MTKPMPQATCPACASQRVVSGRIMAFGAHTANAQRFFPDGLKLLTLKRGLLLDKRAVFSACTDCGHAWSRVDANALREMAQSSGGEAMREVLNRPGPA